MFIDRYLNIAEELTPGKVLLILGPRRVGKSSLLQKFADATKLKKLHLQGDSAQAHSMLATNDIGRLQRSVGDAEVLIIDEAQDIPYIGLSLKLLTDTMPHLAIVATGSSAFELAGQVGEPLTGRKITRYMYPISVAELPNAISHEFADNLHQYLVYGMYPNALTLGNLAEKQEFLVELRDSYLLRDILSYQDVKGSNFILRLLSLLAYQVGSQVSLNELGNTLDVDKNTVMRYLDLLEKSFIVFRLGGYSRNLRNEVSKQAKYYFYDLGVRNSVINNFNSLELRNDIGQLWENFCMVERLKKRAYYGPNANQYFWRTWEGAEIDLVEERGGKLHGYEFKWNDKKSASEPLAWKQTYPDQAEWQLVNQLNVAEFIRSSKDK